MKIAICISGYFGSTSNPTSNGIKGFEYIKRELLTKYNPDVFIHTWDKERALEIYNLYSPWLKQFMVEEQKTFQEEISSLKGDWCNSPCSKFNFLSQAYGRKRSLELKRQYENSESFEYDWVIYCRFDLGLRDLHAVPKYRCCEINFDPSYDSDLFYSKYWNQFNQGFADMWFYSNSKSMDTYSKYYDSIFTHMQPNSEYLTNMTKGWFDSNRNNEFSNEMYMEGVNPRAEFPDHWCKGNNHSLHKWFFKEVGLYDKCKKGAWICQVKK